MKLLFAFLLRWIVTSFGLWLAIRLFGATDTAVEPTIFLVAGFALSLINLIIKPLVTIISFPITVLTLGLFTLIINGLMVYLALKFTPELSMSFWSAVLAGIVIGIVNYVINETLGALKVTK